MDDLTYMPFVVGMVAIIAIVGLPLFAWIIFRLLAHRERMEMIRHGMAPTTVAQGLRPAPYGYDQAVTQLQMRRGVSVAFIGLALLIGLSFIGYDDGRFVLGPWLLGGLIPLFVGLAQIVGARVGGATLTPPHAGSAGGLTSPEGGGTYLEAAQREPQKRPPV